MEFKDYLKQAGYTQAEYAARVGTTQGRISHLVNGESPSLKLAQRIRDESGGLVSLDDWPAPTSEVA